MKYLSRLMALLFVMAVVACGAAADTLPLNSTAEEYAADAQNAGEVLELYNSFMASTTIEEMYYDKLLPAYENSSDLLALFTDEQIIAIGQLANTIYAAVEDPDASVFYQGEDLYMTFAELHEELMAALATVFGEYDWAVYTAYYYVDSKGSDTKYTNLNTAFKNCQPTDTIYVYGTVHDTYDGSAAYRNGAVCNITITKAPGTSGTPHIYFDAAETKGTGRVVAYQQNVITIKNVVLVAQHSETRVSTDNKPLINIYDSGVVNLESGAQLVYGSSIVNVYENGTFNLNGGMLRKATDACITASGNATVNINSGTVKGADSDGTTTTLATVSTPTIIAATGNANVNMSGGSVYGATYNCVELDENAEFTMSSGSIFPCAEANKDIIKNYGDNSTDLTETKLAKCIEAAGYWDKTTFNTAEHGVYVSGNALFTMTGGEIFGFCMDDDPESGYLHGGNAVCVTGIATDTKANIEDRRPAFHFKGGTLYSNYGQDGAGIRLTNENYDNATSYGGGAVIMSGGRVERNSSTNGGGVRVERCTSFKMEGGIIQKNVARPVSTGGGGGGGGGVRLVGSEILMTNGIISENRAFGTNEEQKYNGGGIGAVWQQGFGNVDTKLVISGGSITNNWSNRNGGGIAATDKGNDHGEYNAGINVSITGGTIAYNTTNDCGGGVYVGGNSTVKISGGTITENTAAVNGGGVSIELGSLELGNSGGVITYNNAVHGGGVYMGSKGGTATLFTGAQVANNTATGSGGGVYFVGGGIEANLNLYGGDITNNIAAVNGGGVYADSANVNVGRTASTDMVTISTNTAVDGAGMYLKQAEGSVYQINVVKGVIDNNTASGNGGGICIVDGTGIFLGANGATGGPQLSNNKAVNGAGLAVDGGSPIVYGGTFTSNSATTDGGAVYVDEGSVTMLNGAMASNTATNGNGGAIRIADGDFIMNNGTLSGNEASKNGGAVYVDGGSFTMYGGTIGGENAGNTALNGGAAYVIGGDFEMISGTMSYNTAVEKTAGQAEAGNQGHGGAVYAAGGNIYIGVEDCKGTGDYHTHEPYTSYQHPTVNENTAVFGGALAVNGGEVHIYCGEMKNNHSNNDGTGMNVFMTGDESKLFHYMESAEIGADDNHGMVSVGGSLTIVHGSQNQFTITITYFSNEIQDENGVEITWTGTAPKGYVLNMPYCPKDWQNVQDDNGLTFVGWASNRMEDQPAEIRAKNSYHLIGTPMTIEDIIANPNTEGGEMYFYAVWAPKVNNISYAYTLDKNDTSSVMPWEDTTFPKTYNFAMTSGQVPIGPAEKSGYTFLGWRIYADVKYMSNWDADPKDEVETVSKLADIKAYADYETYNGVAGAKPDYINENSYLPNNTLSTLQNFGDITLVAVFEPAFSGLTIVVTGSSALDENESYYFLVDGNAYDNKSHVTMYVSVIPGENGTGSTTIYNLPVGEYTITEMKDWSWRYAVSDMPSEEDEDFSGRLLMTKTRSTTETNSINVAIPSITEGKKVTFTVERNESRWLDDNENTATKIQ